MANGVFFPNGLLLEALRDGCSTPLRHVSDDEEEGRGEGAAAAAAAAVAAALPQRAPSLPTAVVALLALLGGTR